MVCREVVEFWPIYIKSLLPSGYLRRTIDDRRELLAEVRVARPETMSWMQMKYKCSVQGMSVPREDADIIDETIRESVYELYMLLCVRGQGYRWGDFIDLMILSFLPVI